MKMLLASCLSTAIFALSSAAEPVFRVDAGHSTGKVSPILYGLMTEEINHSYDGGLYGELIRNRAFLDNTNQAPHWAAFPKGNDRAEIALDFNSPYNEQLTASLRVEVKNAAKGNPVGVANDGYWGMPIQANTKYRVMLIVRAAQEIKSPLTISLAGEEDGIIYATKKLGGIGSEWQKVEALLKTGNCKPTTKARFTITTEEQGTFWLAMVSVMPPTWNNRPNGLRKDLMQMLVDLNPKFLRFPGGNYLEGDTIETRFDWKKTIGPIEERHGHPCPWGYRSSDGLGLLEFLEWSEDMKAEPVLAVYAGYSLKGAHVKPGADLEPYVQEALEEIEYVMGDTSTAWGARRAQDGHPKPFKLSYVEIGNEDWFDRSRTYDERFAQFHKAIKARYPQLKTISSIGMEQPENIRVRSVQPDMLDEHYYRATDEFLKMTPDYARKYDRHGPEIFVGEWAAHENSAIKPWSPEAKQQPPTPTMLAAIGDAALMAAMERNADVIKMHCYAPLLVNVNPGARQWRPDLIGYDALTSFGSPSYYAFHMFSRNLGDELLATTSAETAVQGCATKDSRSGKLIIKLVNPETNAVPLHIQINGVGVKRRATVLTLTGKPDDLNSLGEPRKVAPTTSKLPDVGPAFTHTLPPLSVEVLKLATHPL